MSFSGEQASELKDLFFESAAELLQTLNEEGLALERRAGDKELLRSVRRTVHTLKGDSAACGYRDLSELAHELEDVLTPELAVKSPGPFAEMVLSAADVFGGMLNAYRNNTALPSGDGLRAHIQLLANPPVTIHSAPAAAPGARESVRFEWSEYDQMVITSAVRSGKPTFQVALGIDEHCPLRSAALQLVRNVLEEAGEILAIQPEASAPAESIQVIKAAIASDENEDWISRKCQIPAVVSDILVQPIGFAAVNEALPKQATTQAEDVLGILPAHENVHLGLNSAFHLDIAPSKQAESKAQAESAAEPKGTVEYSGLERRGTKQPKLEAEFVPAPQVTAETTLRVDAERIDAVLNLVGELIIGKSMMNQNLGEFERRFPKDVLGAKLADAMAFQARVLTDLQKSVMKIRMVPVEQLFRRFPRIVRDVAKAKGKEVELQLSGLETDLDKSILDVLSEPLTHLVRNAVDHGIESPAERVAAGKPAQGAIRLNAYHQGNQVVIEVSDDGAGIDREKVVAKAIECKVISASEAGRLTEGEALELIFHPGLSTANEVTEISGRGVGMDVVKTVLQRLKGSVDIQSKPGAGSTFFLKVPLTLAIIKALMFRVGRGDDAHMYAVPLASVLEITRASEADIHRVDQHEVCHLRDQVLTLVRLVKLKKGAVTKNAKVFIIVIQVADRKFGLVVDQLVGEEELVIKALNDHLVATDLVSGASILGDGTVVLILDIPSVVSRLGKAGAQIGESVVRAKGAGV